MSPRDGRLGPDDGARPVTRTPGAEFPSHAVVGIGKAVSFYTAVVTGNERPDPPIPFVSPVRTSVGLSGLLPLFVATDRVRRGR